MFAKVQRVVSVRAFFFPANLLTIARLLMLPAVLRALRRSDDRWRALGILGVAMVTDALDGPMARHRHEVSSLGKMLDPIADKVLIDATALVLARTRGFPKWVVALLMARDFGIVCGAVLLYHRRDEVVMAHATGKVTTLVLTTALLLYIADGPRSGRWALALALIPLLCSVVVYGRRFLGMQMGEGAPESSL